MTSFLMSAGLLLSATQFQLDERAIQTASFEVHHPMRSVKGSSHQVEGRMELLPDGTLRAQLRAPLQSFETGDANSNEYLQESLDSFRHPFVDVKVVARVDRGRSYPSGVLEVPASAQVTLHGVSRRFPVLIWLAPRSGQGTTASGTFSIDLEDFQIVPPAFMFLPVSRQIQVRFEVQTAEDIALAAPGVDPSAPRPLPSRNTEGPAGVRGEQLTLGE